MKPRRGMKPAPPALLGIILGSNVRISGFRPGRGERPRDIGHAARRTSGVGGTASFREYAGARIFGALLGHTAAVARDPARAGGGHARPETRTCRHRGGYVGRG